MKADLATRLRRSMRGESIPKTGVAGVTDVAGVSATCDNSLQLQWLRPLRLENDKLANNVVRGVSAHVTGPPDPDEAERAAIGIELGGVPLAYADAWARLQCQKPMAVSDDERRQAIDDAALLLDQWGSLAVEFQWSPGDLFDVPRDGKPGGLVWFLKGEAVRALGHTHAITESGRDFLRENDFNASLLQEGAIK
jgi:hypothetical protein